MLFLCRLLLHWLFSTRYPRSKRIHGQPHAILGLIDHSSRRLLSLGALPNKSAWTLLGYLFLAIGRYGKPQVIRSDNERIFTGRVFRTGLRLAGIRQQFSDLGCPWQNGRIERLFGTLKGKLNQWRVWDVEQLQRALEQFHFWYNAVRPHQNLGGRTPLEVWRGINPYRQRAKREEWFEAWTVCCRVTICAFSGTNRSTRQGRDHRAPVHGQAGSTQPLGGERRDFEGKRRAIHGKNRRVTD